jgi:hypothetical protein
MLIDEKTNLLKKKEDLKKEIKEINKKLKAIYTYEYQLNAQEIHCTCCGKDIKKYAYPKHILSKIHLSNEKIKGK